MRIVAGSLGGRIFSSPNSRRTHPMSDKMRGALFNVLGDIGGARVLDAFAGSGALSFEALSRGAAHAVAIDIDKLAITTIVKSQADLDLQGRLKAIRAGAGSWLETAKSEERYDLVLLDPPYDNLQPTLLVRLADRTTIGGRLVVSLPPVATIDLPSSYHLLTSKDYGDSQLLFFERQA